MPALAECQGSVANPPQSAVHISPLKKGQEMFIPHEIIVQGRWAPSESPECNPHGQDQLWNLRTHNKND